jgi:hypothetical protein
MFLGSSRITASSFRGGRSLPGPCLEHVEPAVLHRKFEVLDVLVVLLEPGRDLLQLLEDPGHLFFHLRDAERCPGTCHHVLALRVDEIFAVELFPPGGGITRESDTRRAIVPHVPEHHHLYVDGSPDVVRYVVRLSVIPGPIVVPRFEDRVARERKLHAGIRGKFLPGP